MVKFIAKWKRKARRSREQRLAAEAAARGEDPAAVQTEPEPKQGPDSQLRLGPLKLGGFRRASARPFANGIDGPLTARPRSGRPPIEKDHPSLPPMYSSGQRVHPLQQNHTSLDMAEQEHGDAVMANGGWLMGAKF